MKKRIIASSIAVFLLVFYDIFTKSFIDGALSGNMDGFAARGEFVMNKWLSLVRVYNQGISFGMLSSFNSRIPLLVITAIVIYFLTKFYIQKERITLDSKKKIDFFEKRGYIFIISGGLGNFIDRLGNGTVFDFIDLHIGKYHWPAFNFADIYVCIGVTVLAIVELYRYLQKRKLRNK